MNPLTKLAFVIVVGAPLLVTLDPVSAGLTLVLELAAMPLMLVHAPHSPGAPGPRLSPRRLAILATVILAASATSGLVTLLYGKPGGATWATWGPVMITDHSAWLALATTLRVGAIALPAVVLFASIDLTSLADALTQLARLPERFVLGSLAGLSTLALSRDDLALVRRARRARGLPATPVHVLMPLLVLNLRRAETLAVAMDSRGFHRAFGALGANGAKQAKTRTHLRVSILTWRDAVGAGLAIAIAATATTVAILTGAWHFVIA